MSFRIPIITIVAMPTYQVIMAASLSPIPLAFIARKQGPRTTRAMPIVEGVSRPRGIAVTSRFPVLFARRNAIHV